MNEPISEEILSAYLDGELSPRERAEVEQWLEKSPEAREQLEDFRGLSKLFAGLPRTEVSQEFPVKVLQLAERRMLLPEMATVSVKRSFHRRMVVTVGAFVSAAAVLLVIVQIRHSGMPPRGLVLNNNPPAPGVPSGNQQTDSGSRVTNEAIALKEGKEIASRAATIAPPAAPPAKDAPAAASLADTRDAGKQLPADRASAKEPTAEIADSQSSKENETPADDERALPEIAALSREMDRLAQSDADADRVSVVTIRIDHADGMTLVQKMFVSQDVMPAGIEEARRDTEKTADIAAPAVAGGRARDSKECLIVVAEPEKVLAALTKILQREDRDVQFSVEPSLEIAALDGESQKLLKLAETSGSPGKDGATHGAKLPGAAPRSADKAADREGREKSDGDASPGVESLKSKRDVDAAPEAAAKLEKKADARPGEPTESSRRQEQTTSGNKAPAKKQMATRRDGGQAAPGQALQFVAPIPKAIENRQLAAAAKKPLASDDSSSLENLKSATARPMRKSTADGRSTAEGEAAARPPAWVRVLFVIEPGAAPPAAPPPARKDAPGEKVPSDGAL